MSGRLYTIEVAVGGRILAVRSAFPLEPLVGDTLHYRMPGDPDGETQLLLAVCHRTLSAGSLGGISLGVELDANAQGGDELIELLESYGFRDRPDV